MIVKQTALTLSPRPRGIHLITGDVDAALESDGIDVGPAHLFLQHTSASLTLNENASPEVRRDLDAWLGRAVPDGASYFEHRFEGPDDMPAHVKISLLGSGITVPIRRGQLALGRWQGVYLCEHRNSGGARSLILTAFGL